MKKLDSKSAVNFGIGALSTICFSHYRLSQLEVAAARSGAKIDVRLTTLGMPLNSVVIGSLDAVEFDRLRLQALRSWRGWVSFLFSGVEVIGVFLGSAFKILHIVLFWFVVIFGLAVVVGNTSILAKLIENLRSLPAVELAHAVKESVLFLKPLFLTSWLFAASGVAMWKCMGTLNQSSEFDHVFTGLLRKHFKEERLGYLSVDVGVHAVATLAI